MKRLYLYILLSVLSFCAVVSCGEDPLEPEQPAEKVDIMDIYYSGRFFRSGSLSEEGATLRFKGGESVTIPTSSLKVFDCRKRSFPKMSINYNKEEWMYNSINSGVKVDRNLSDREAVPVCAAFDSTSIHIYMNNASELVIPDSPEKSLASFNFLVSDNSSLPESMVCSITEGHVLGYLPEGVKNFKLIPSFTFRGKAITVNGKDQKSGEDKQDFSGKVVYSLELFDGTIVDYEVEIKVGKSFPTVYIYTKNKARITSRTTYVPGTIRIEDLEGRYGGDKILEASMQIRGRGNATWNNDYSKKPYRIKLDEKASVFGLPKNRDWILLANHADKSLLRNVVAFKISEICQMPWTPAIFNVDVYINDVYYGLYNLCDHKEVAKHRVDINVVGPDDNSGTALEGDYYLEIDQTQDEHVNWYTDLAVPMMFKDPQDPTKQQIQYIKNLFHDFEKALTDKNFDEQHGYPKYIDVESFINNYIVQEVTKNIDGNCRKSTFLTKEQGKKLRIYHVWDFDFTIGNCDYYAGHYGSGLTNTYKELFILYYGANGYGSGWYYRLQKDKNFRLKVRNRWNELYPELSKVPDFIDEQYEQVKLAANRNFATYNILNTYLWPNPVVLGNYQAEVEYMKQFLKDRLVWLNGQINSPSFIQ